MAALIPAVSLVDPLPVAPKFTTLSVTPLFDTLIVMEVLAVTPDVFVAWAKTVCVALDNGFVLRVKVQLAFPEAREKTPPSI
jgi:hypothetical protein